MSPSSRSSIFRTVRQAADGCDVGRSQLVEALQAEFERILRSSAHDGGPGRARSATDLVHEVYLTTFEGNGDSSECRRAFFSAATRAMERLLLDHGGRRPVGADESDGVQELLAACAAGLPLAVEQLAPLVRALERLRAVDPQAGEIVALRCLLGIEGPDIAWILGLPESTVQEDWCTARLWLARAIAEDDERDGR